MEATRLALALLVGFLVLGMCLSKPAQKEKRMQRRHETRQYYINCTEGDFVCSSGDCIYSYWECDNFQDCPDNDDEAGCSCEDYGQLTCSSGDCIPAYWQCDNVNDCPDGDDEVACGDGYCTESEFACNSGTCIPSYWQCDNWDDCPDAEDEAGCPYDSYDFSWGSSSYGYSWDSYYYGGPDYCDYQCYSGECIFSSWVCDGIIDCSEGEDESGCDPYYEQDLLHFCLLSDVVVPTWMACDRIIDCPFGDDEWLGCYGIHDGLGFAKKKRSTRELPAPLSKLAKKHMKTEKSLTDDQKEILAIISDKESAMKKSRLGSKKALVN